MTRATLQALRDPDTDRIWVVGGTGTVPPAVADQLAATGATVHRIAGSTRYATGHAAYDRAVDGHDTRVDRVAEPLTGPATVVGGPRAITERWVTAKLE